MKIEAARACDAQAICDLVNHYAERGLMLHRSLESVYDCLREFFVAREGDAILGCVALDVFWADLAEIRSLAVAEAGKGMGRLLVEATIRDARRLGVTKVFAMTYEQEFFQRLGFAEVPLKSLPEKVWRECLDWYDCGHRHETAMLIELADEQGE